MYSFNSNIRYSEVDSNCKLTWLSLLDYFQDCSVFHSEEKKVGTEYLCNNHLAWVLSYWQIRCEDMPSICESVEISTWPYAMKSFMGWRNFTMNNEAGKRIAWANSIWALVDTVSGRPSKIPDEIMNSYEYEEKIDVEYADRKIEVPDDFEEYEGVVVPSYFIDSNNHMNNGKYVAVALNYLPDDFEVKELRAEYKKSAMLGDLIIPRVTCDNDNVTVVLISEESDIYAIVQFCK